MGLEWWGRNRRPARRAAAPVQPAPRPSVPLGEGASLRGDGPALPGPVFAGLQFHDGAPSAVLRLGGGWVIDITPHGIAWLDMLARAIGEARDHLTPDGDDDGKRM